MAQEFQLTEIDTEFEEKVYVIADEILKILKELSQENKRQISSKNIADKMFRKDSVKNVLNSRYHETSENGEETRCLKEFSNMVLNKVTEIVPTPVIEQLSNLKKQIHNKEIIGGSKEWFETPFNIIKKYIYALSSRNQELEEFMQQTMLYLTNTETHIKGELSSRQRKFYDDRDFENIIAKNMNVIKDNINISGDFNRVRMAFMDKIENINKCIKQKRQQDMLNLKETEKTLEEMSKKMTEIKREADDIRKQSQEIEFESVRDALTRLYNRKAYDEKIIETLAHFERYNVSSSLMLCDIDFFKKINDNFGHQIGDLALKKLAVLLNERLRKNDFISRYGGEEFAIILPHTNLDGAFNAGEGIRSYIDKSEFSYKNQTISLTISVGISSFMKGDNSNTVFERADSALYLAKRSGRNTVKTEKDVIEEGTVLHEDPLDERSD